MKAHYNSQLGQWNGELPITKAALGENSGQIGGYTVPPDYAKTLLAPMWPLSILRRFGALIVPTDRRSAQLPMPDLTTPQSAGVPPYFGGFTMKWTPENTALTENDPQFKGVEMVRYMLGGAITVSAPMIHDTDLLAWLTPQVAHACHWLEEYAFFNGTGAGQPQGILNSPAAVTLARNMGSKFLAADAEAMIAKLPPGSYDRAVWAVNPTALGANGWSGITGIIPNGPLTLFGRPVVPTDVLPALGTKGDVCLIDPSFYAICQEGEEMGTLEIAVSEHVYFTKNQYVIAVIRRLDGQPILDKPITLGDGSTTSSPFVILN